MARGPFFYGQRQGMVIRPNNDAGEAVLKKIPQRMTFKVTVEVERNTSASNLYFSLCHRVSKALKAMGKDYASKEWVDYQLRMSVEHTMPMRTPAKYRAALGPVIPTVKSLSFESMDFLQFRDFMDKVTHFLTTELLPSLPEGPELAGIVELLDPAARRAWKLQKDWDSR